MDASMATTSNVDSFLKMICLSWPTPPHVQVFHVPNYNPIMTEKRLLEIGEGIRKRCMILRGDQVWWPSWPTTRSLPTGSSMQLW